MKKVKRNIFSRLFSRKKATRSSGEELSEPSKESTSSDSKQNSVEEIEERLMHTEANLESAEVAEIEAEEAVAEKDNESKEAVAPKKQRTLKKTFKQRIAAAFAIRTLDKYILKKFLGTYFLATMLILAVVAMFDITEKLDAFLTAPLKETLFDYFASFIPYFGNQLSPLFVFISVIFFTSKMAGNSEIIAILSSGISFRRLLRPYMIGAALIASLTFVLANYIIPPTNIRRINYTEKYVKNKKLSGAQDVQLMVSPGVVAFFGSFDDRTKTGYSFSLDKFEGKRLVSHLTAQNVRYDTTRMYHWEVSNYMIRDMGERREKITRGAKMDTILSIEPRDVLIQHNDQETMTSPQLEAYVKKQRDRGVANIEAFEIEKEKRYASTAAAFILTLIGMSLSSRKTKGGMGLNIGIGLALSFSYILFSTITSSFAISGLTSPMIAMEIPNIVYLVIGIILYIRASKF